MASCELCGTDVDSLITTKISGAELDVCADCTQHGEPLDMSGNESETTTKYSTGSSSDSGNQNTSSSTDTAKTETTKTQTTSQQSSQPSDDSFEDVHDLALNYGDIIQNGRNSQGYNRAELADELGIKQSHLQNIENETTQPSVSLQEDLEKFLEIDLSSQDVDFDG